MTDASFVYNNALQKFGAESNFSSFQPKNQTFTCISCRNGIECSLYEPF